MDVIESIMKWIVAPVAALARMEERMITLFKRMDK